MVFTPLRSALTNPPMYMGPEIASAPGRHLIGVEGSDEQASGSGMDVPRQEDGHIS